MSCWRLLLRMKETLDIVRQRIRKAGFKILRLGCCHGQTLKEWWSYFQTKNQNVSQANRLYCSWYKGHSEEKKFRCRSNDFNTHFNSGSMGITGPITWNIGCLKFYNMGILKEKLVAVVLVTKLCLTLCDPVDCSPPVFSVLGILQARIVKWGAIPFSRGIFLAHRSNPGLLHCRQILYCMSHLGSLKKKSGGPKSRNSQDAIIVDPD